MAFQWMQVLLLLYLSIQPRQGEGVTLALARAERSTEDTLDLQTIEALLTNQTPSTELVSRLAAFTSSITQKIRFIATTIENLPRQLTQQLSARDIISTEIKLRNMLDDYRQILEETRKLHQSGTSNQQTFSATAQDIQRNLDQIKAEVSRDFPGLLRSLDRNLRGDTLAGTGSTEGLLCDAAVNALESLNVTRNLVATVKDGPVAMLEGLIELQELAVDLLAITCRATDTVCLARVTEFQAFPGEQRKRFQQCIPVWVTSLAKDNVVSGRLRLLPSNKALTQAQVYNTGSDQTSFFPELQQLQEGSQQVVTFQREPASNSYRLVIDGTCYVTLHNQRDFLCAARSTTQDALFAVETSRDGSTWLWNVQTQRYLVAGETQERCREGVLGLSQQRGSPWTFDSSFRPGSGNTQTARPCTPAPTTPAPQRPAGGSNAGGGSASRAVRSDPRMTSLLLPLLTLLLLLVASKP